MDPRGGDLDVREEQLRAGRRQLAAKRLAAESLEQARDRRAAEGRQLRLELRPVGKAPEIEIPAAMFVRDESWHLSRKEGPKLNHTWLAPSSLQVIL